VKIDVLATPPDKLPELVRKARAAARVKLLAEKVDTRAQADRCRDLGFDLFQGYFFARPVLMQGRRTDPSKRVLMRLLEQTLDDEILRRQPVTFRSSKVTRAGGGWRAEGELTLLGATRPFAFDVRLGDDGSIGAEAVLKQTLWGLKPYSTLFGALKVVDEVTIRVDAGLRA